MSTKTKTIQIPVYETPKGKPTCSSDWAQNKTCLFLRTCKFGTVELCALSGEKLERAHGVNGVRGMGYLIPCESCILHNNK